MVQEKLQNTPEKQPATMWNRYFVLLLVMDIGLQLGGFVSRPVISNFVIGMGAALSIAGLIAGMATTTATILRPVTGYLADRVSKKKSLVISTIAFTVAAFGCAFAPSPFWVGLFCAVQGLALSFKSISVSSLVALSVPANRLGSAIGLIGLVGTVAMAIGPGVGAWIADTWEYHACFLTAGFLCLAGCIIACVYKPSPAALATRKPSASQAQPAADAQPEGKPRESFVVRLTKQAFYFAAIPFAVIVIFTSWSNASMSALVLTITDMGYLEAGALYFTAYAFAAMAARPLAGRLSDAFGVAAVGIPGCILAMAAMALLVFVHSAGAVIATGVLMGLGQASAQCAVQAESMRGVDTSCLGRASNTYYMGMDIGNAAGPLVGGFILQVATPQLLFTFNAITYVIALTIILVMRFKRGPKNPRRETAQARRDWREALAKRFKRPARIK